MKLTDIGLLTNLDLLRKEGIVLVAREKKLKKDYKKFLKHLQKFLTKMEKR
jgi:hypothetical protein